MDIIVGIWTPVFKHLPENRSVCRKMEPKNLIHCATVVSRESCLISPMYVMSALVLYRIVYRIELAFESSAEEMTSLLENIYRLLRSQALLRSTTQDNDNSEIKPVHESESLLICIISCVRVGQA